MIQIKKTGERKFIVAQLAPLFDLLAWADGQYVPAQPFKRVRVYTRKGVRVYTRKGVARPKLTRLV